MSACSGGTLKVWNSGERWIRNRSSLSKLTLTASFAATLELVTEKSNAHSSGIRSVAFSPDGKTIVSGSADQTLKVWNSGER